MARGPTRTGRWRWLGLGALLLVGTEGLLRLLGLGNPVLYMTDPELEYVLRPSRESHRLGRTLRLNAWSMRSDDFPRAKPAGERRVLVLGDSITHGGALVSHEELATTRLQEALRTALGAPLVVGNASTPSWGPPNQLAYVRRHGLFDADVVLLVVNNGDFVDVPTGVPLVGAHPDWPDRAPRTALGELLTRYGQRVLPAALQPAPPAPPAATPENRRAATEAFRALLRTARAGGAHVLVAQHPEEDELTGPLRAGHAALARVAAEEGVPVLALREAYAAAHAGGRRLFTDGYHLSVEGQRVLADALQPHLLAALRAR